MVQSILAEADQISRLYPPSKQGDAYRVEPIIENLPYKAGGKLHLHPLKAFAFQDEKTLWVNSGSVSDRCLINRTQTQCHERVDTAAVLNFQFQDGSWVRMDDIAARGLRNSIGLAAHRAGTVLQAGNGSDLKDPQLPPEELNVVKASAHYGWPYCYGFNGIDSRWAEAEFECSESEGHTQAVGLLPAHGAPLDLIYAPAGALGYKTEKLIVPLHGYRETGHRVLMFDVDDNGIPDGEPSELIAGWNAEDTKPRGAPVGLAIASDGSVWGVEDKNKTVFRIAQDKYQPRAWLLSANASEQAQGTMFAQLHKDIFVPHCAACHAEFSGSAVESARKLTTARWFGANANV